MEIKDRVVARLQRMDLIEGVLPTRPRRTESLTRMAFQLRENDVPGAVRSAVEDLGLAHPGLGNEPATSLFAESTTLREQVAGFAAAGINLFQADKRLIDTPLASRAKVGGSDAVSRVLVSNQRIYLETSRIVVRFNPQSTKPQRETILKKHNVAEISKGGLLPDTVIGALVAGGNALQRCLDLMNESEILFAEPDFVEHIGQRYSPTDPEYARQWQQRAIGAELAWDVTKGKGVSVAMIDNGFENTHKDLQFGPLSGWFRSTPDHVDADFEAGHLNMPAGSHGTSCAGMIGAREGNGFGGCGVAFESTLSLISCADDQVGTQSTLARAVAYAAAPDLEPAVGQARSAGADIIVSSLGPNTAKWEISQVMSDALDFAATQGRDGKGCAIFWACTNGNFPISSDEICSHNHVIAVGRSGESDNDDGCGFGSQLEFLAPGVQVWLPTGGDNYQSITGTSFAAPCAAGVAALALSQNNGLSAVDLRQLLRNTCDKIGSMSYIGGRNARFGSMPTGRSSRPIVLPRLTCRTLMALLNDIWQIRLIGKA
jgi:hypothetical protein